MTSTGLRSPSRSSGASLYSSMNCSETSKLFMSSSAPKSVHACSKIRGISPCGRQGWVCSVAGGPAAAEEEGWEALEAAVTSREGCGRGGGGSGSGAGAVGAGGGGGARLLGAGAALQRVRLARARLCTQGAAQGSACASARRRGAAGQAEGAPAQTPGSSSCSPAARRTAPVSREVAAAAAAQGVVGSAAPTERNDCRLVSPISLNNCAARLDGSTEVGGSAARVSERPSQQA